MSDYSVTVEHTTGLSFTVGNGRSTLSTEWQPDDGSWLATELFLAGIGACMLATLTSYAQTNGIDVTGAGVEVSADSAAKPSRMSRIIVTYRLPGHLSDSQLQALLRAGDRCKVHNTLHTHPEFVVHAESRPLTPIPAPSTEPGAFEDAGSRRDTACRPGR